MNHIWQDAKFGENWFTAHEIYRRMVQNCRLDGKLVEVGCWKGRSAAFLLVEAYRRSPSIRVYAVDPWVETSHSQFLDNLLPVSHCLTSLQMASPEAAKEFADASLDGVFIDADHTYPAVRKDILAWRPKVRKGGILAGHDYSQSWPGVCQAVDELVENRVIEGECWVTTC